MRSHFNCTNATKYVGLNAHKHFKVEQLFLRTNNSKMTLVTYINPIHFVRLFYLRTILCLPNVDLDKKAMKIRHTQQSKTS